MVIRAMMLACAAIAMLASHNATAADEKMSWPDWLLDGAKSCNKSWGLSDTNFGALVGEGRTLEAADALFNKILQDKIKAQQACLAEMKPSAPSEYKAGIDAAIAATYADLHALAASSRPKFIANPASYTLVGQTNLRRYADYDPEKLTAALGIYATLKTLEQACGTYEFVTPSNERAAVDRAWNAAQPYLQCVDGYHKNSPPFSGYFGSHLRVVA